MMTAEQRKARRKLIAKRVAVRKMMVTQARKRARRIVGERSVDDDSGIPETDAALDELPSSLVG